MQIADVLLALLAVQSAKPSDGPRPPPADGCGRLGEDMTDRFVVPEGVRVTVFAVTPQLFNPTNLDVDARGRIWVTEGVNYRRFNTQKEGRLFHPDGDRVVILEDADGDGVCDSSKCFVQEEALLAPLGIAVLGPPKGPREVWVSCSPDLIRYVDTDGDDVPDRREVVLHGFGGRDHDHSLHSVVAGPDGRLYFNAGNAGPHVVTDRDGFKLVASSIGDMAPSPDVRTSSDGRTYVGGLALRMRPDGGGLEVLAHNFRNCYEVAVDSYGDLWQNDNDDGFQGCRITWLQRGANQGYASVDGRRSWMVDEQPGQSRLLSQWHQDDPGVMPMGAITGAGAPTGVVVYEGDLFGPKMNGAILSCDAGRNAIYCCRPVLAGGGFDLKAELFLTSVPKDNPDYDWSKVSDDQRTWFRPSDVVVGLDGALYVADWWDPIVGGHAMNDDGAVGRILRIAPRGNDPGAFKKLVPDLSTIQGALAALALPAIDVRRAAFERLAQEPASLPEWVVAFESAKSNAALRARLLALIATAGAAGSGHVEALGLHDADPRVRAAAIRAAPPPTSTVDGKRCWSGLFRDPSPFVRREAVNALRSADVATRLALAIELAPSLDGHDRFAVETFGQLCEGCESQVWVEVAAQLGDTPTKWDARFEAITWRLHPPAALDGLVARARAPGLDAGARRRAVDAIAFVNDARAADAMVALALDGPADTQPLALFWVRLRDGDEWKAFRPAEKLGVGTHEAKDARWRSGIVKAGDEVRVKSCDVDITGARALWLVVDDGGDGINGDWADWCEPTLHGPDGAAADVSLAEMKPLVALAGWGSVRFGRNCDGGEALVDGVKPATVIGTHARSEIGFRLPAGTFTRFTVRAAPDDGGTKRAGSKTSLEFLVFADLPEGSSGIGANRTKALAQKARLLAKETPAAERRKLAGELASDPEGGIVVIELARRGELQEDLREIVTTQIYRNPDFSVRALAAEVFTRATDDGVKLPPPKQLLALSADAARGRAVFFGERAGCAKCHAFGNADVKGHGDVGPDLTAIHTKYGRPELLDAILNPSAAIAPGFEPWIVERKDGALLTGFLLADGDPLVLKDPTGARISMAAGDVASKRRSKLSLMPDNVALGLTAQELADLVAFLATGK